jgi:hypothetical protein
MPAKMKLQFAVLVIVVLAGFLFIGRIIFGRSWKESKKVMVILGTSHMTEADNSVVDSAMSGLVVASIYLAGKEQNTNNAVPLADAFVCVSHNNSDSSKTDTTLLLDTQLQHSNEDIGNPTKFETEIRPAKKLSECRVLIPEELVKRLKTYKYKYSDLVLVTDD